MLSMYLLLVMIANYAIITYRVSTSTAGLVSSVFIIGALIGRLYTGKKIDGHGAKRILLIGIFIFLIMSCFYFVPISIQTLIAIRFIQGIGIGVATTATSTIVARIIPRTRMGEGISYFSISVVLSTAIGPLIGVALLQRFSYVSIFIFSFTMGILCLLLALMTRVPKSQTSIHDTKLFQLSSFF